MRVGLRKRLFQVAEQVLGDGRVVTTLRHPRDAGGLVGHALGAFGDVAIHLDEAGADLEAWRVAAADPDRLLDDPDFCFRESFVTTVGRVPA